MRKGRKINKKGPGWTHLFKNNTLVAATNSSTIQRVYYKTNYILELCFKALFLFLRLSSIADFQNKIVLLKPK